MDSPECYRCAVKIAKAPKQFVFKRLEPCIPSEMITPESAFTLFDSVEISIAGALIKDLRVENRTADTLHIEGSVLERVSLCDCTFGSIVLKDVRLIGCDLANLQARGVIMVRVELINCRMMGFYANEAKVQDLLISEGDQRYSQFRFAHFKSSEFNSCNFEEADFRGTDLSGSIFRKCDLQRSDMNRAKLVNTDLRGSVVDGMLMVAEDIRGAIVDPAQAMFFASLLGIRIE